MHIKNSVTLLATFKPFHGEDKILQNVATETWSCRGFTVIVFGNEIGSSNVVQKLKARHVPEVKSSPDGAPYIADIISKGCEIAETPYVALVNGDIIVDERFVHALKCAIVSAEIPEDTPRFISTRRRNIPIYRQYEGAEIALKEVACIDEVDGNWDRHDAIDIFVFPVDLYKEIPDLAIGRAGWDN